MTMTTETRPAVLDLIGNTPLVQVTRLDTSLCTLFLKLESQNPGGSIKDRVGLAMIEAAERDGRLRPGGTVVEATAGNTGLGLALVARAKGHRVVLVVPDKMSTEKVLHLKALGAEVHITRSDVGKGHPAYYQDYAARLAKEIPGAFFVDQFNNPDNPLAHASSTGPEIWQQCGHELDAIVAGVGSGGTITGLTRYFRTVQPALCFVPAVKAAAEKVAEQARATLEQEADAFDAAMILSPDYIKWSEGAVKVLAAADAELSDKQEQMLVELEDMARAIANDTPALAKAKEWVIEKLPRFIYVDEYPALPGPRTSPTTSCARAGGKRRPSSRTSRSCARSRGSIRNSSRTSWTRTTRPRATSSRTVPAPSSLPKSAGCGRTANSRSASTSTGRTWTRWCPTRTALTKWR